MPKEPSDELRAAWVDEIQKNGVKRLKVRTLLKAFGAERRGAATLERIENWCRTHGLHPNGLKSGGLDGVVSLSDVEIKRIGDLVEDEQRLAERFPDEIAHQLELETIARHFEPQGSRDRLDFLCRDRQGRPVIVELKRADGGKRAVEQVLRYLRLLRKDSRFADSELRGLILAGEGDLATRHALEELPADCPIDWYVYGIIEGDRIRVERQDVNGARRATASDGAPRPKAARPPALPMDVSASCEPTASPQSAPRRSPSPRR